MTSEQPAEEESRLADRRLQRPEISPEQGRESLREHLLAKAAEIRARYGGLDHSAVLRLLEDRSAVRYPVMLVYDADPLQPGEFGYMHQIADHPREGFILYLDPCYRACPEELPLLIAYQLVVVNYGEIAGNDEAEIFGAALCGLEREDYYARVCALADRRAVGGC